MRRPWRRTPAERLQRAVATAQSLGIRGTVTCDAASLPDGFVPPSAALTAQDPESPSRCRCGEPDLPVKP